MRYNHPGFRQGPVCSYSFVSSPSSATVLPKAGNISRLYPFQSPDISFMNREGVNFCKSTGIPGKDNCYFLRKRCELHQGHMHMFNHFSEVAIIGSTYNEHKPVYSYCGRLGTFSFMRGNDIVNYSIYLSINRCYS